jgi:hypothetical protein
VRLDEGGDVRIGKYDVGGSERPSCRAWGGLPASGSAQRIGRAGMADFQKREGNWQPDTTPSTFGCLPDADIAPAPAPAPSPPAVHAELAMPSAPDHCLALGNRATRGLIVPWATPRREACKLKGSHDCEGETRLQICSMYVFVSIKLDFA